MMLYCLTVNSLFKFSIDYSKKNFLVYFYNFNMDPIDAFLLHPSPSLADSLLASISISEISQFCKANRLKGPDLLENLSRFNKLDFLSSFGIDEIFSLLCTPHLSATVINSLSNQDVSQTFSKPLLISMLNFITQEDLGIAIAAQNFITRKLISSFLDDEVLQTLRKLTHEVDSTIQLRLIELAIEAGNRNLQVFNSLSSTDIYEMALDMFTSDDLLTRLASIEMVAELGNSEQGCKILLKEKVRNMIHASVDDESNDIYTRTKLLLLACKIYSYTGNAGLLEGKFWSVVEEALRSNDPAMINNGLTGLTLISSRPQGLALIASNGNLITAFAKLQSSPNENSKIGFYIVLAEFATHGDDENVRKVLTNCNWISPVLKEISIPFQEVLISILKAAKSLLRYP